ncbi:hypothetical protein [uncultured Erythrobacter sp.]|uniref:hypothetical protein n=1 Tax=uncultured Erythrobacter sp. TaxID=263913 RepID=UPI00261B1A40|nr:hypothetical protein [uncultured Erythrobacter sp.]
MKRVLFGPLLALLIASPAAAFPRWCDGTATNFHIRTNGDAIYQPSWRGGEYVQVCNVRVEWKGVPPDVCLTWIAKIDAAIVFGKRIRLKYNDAPPCEQMPINTNAPGPDYVMLMP